MVQALMARLDSPFPVDSMEAGEWMDRLRSVPTIGNHVDLRPLQDYATRSSGSVSTMRACRPGAVLGDTNMLLRIKFASSGGAIYVDEWRGVLGMGRAQGVQRLGQSYRGEMIDVLKEIVADPLAALKAFAAKTSKCGVCGRDLTDPPSVTRGIGPDCAARLGLI